MQTTTKTKTPDGTKRYPVLFRCQHCGADHLTRKDGIKIASKTWMTCPVCRFGALERMHWNGFRWC